MKPSSHAPTERIASIVQSLEERRTAGTLPDALLCFYDEMAIDTLVAIRQMGLVPGMDIAVVGFNGSEGLDRLDCPLTSVRQPVEQMCALAFEFLQAQMDDLDQDPNPLPVAEPLDMILTPAVRA